MAWRREKDEGGEFGIQFTALDAGSVDALRSLCKVRESAPALGDNVESSPVPSNAQARGFDCTSKGSVPR